MSRVDLIQDVAEKFRESGFGMVVACAYSEGENFYVKCFSTVRNADVNSILNRIARNVSRLAFDDASVMNGTFIAETESSVSKELVQWGANHLELEEPMVVACVEEGGFSAFGVGDAPMLVYIAVKILSSMGEDGISLNSYIQSMN